MPMTPFPPRRCARNALTAVRLINPPWVMLIIHPSFAMRSSMLISPSSAMNSDLLDLLSRKFESEQFHARFVTVGRIANDSNEFIEINQRDQIPFEGFGALFRFA